MLMTVSYTHLDVYKRQEFSSEEEALAYEPPAWFGEDVTYSTKYHNSTLSKGVGV